MCMRTKDSSLVGCYNIFTGEQLPTVHLLSKQGTTGKRKHVTLIICQKLEIIRWLETGKSQKEVFFRTTLDCQLLYDVKKQKDHL
jgi:hypothetical protein